MDGSVSAGLAAALDHVDFKADTAFDSEGSVATLKRSFGGITGTVGRDYILCAEVLQGSYRRCDPGGFRVSQVEAAEVVLE